MLHCKNLNLFFVDRQQENLSLRKKVKQQNESDFKTKDGQ